MMHRRYFFLMTAPIMATSLLLLVVGGGAAWYVHQVNQDASELASQNLECTLALEQLVLRVRDVRLQLHRFLESGDAAALAQIVELEKEATEHLESAQEAATTDEIRELMAGVKARHVKLFATLNTEIAEFSRDTDSTRAKALTRTVSDDLLAPAESLLSRSQQLARAQTRKTRELADRVGLVLLLLGACGSVGGLLGGFGISRAVARRIEQSEREATHSAQLAAVGQLAAGLAHELRNPLTSMRVLVEAAAQEPQTQGLDTSDLAVLDEEISKLAALVDSFLDFARPPQPARRPVEMVALLGKIVEFVQSEARQRGSTIHWTTPEKQVWLEVDAVQIRQVLLNLLLNAMDTVGEGGTVDVHCQEAGPGREAIIVADNGPGVPEDMKERIFEPFVSTKETGLGLGLAVSRRIAEAHGGTLKVTDNPGGGARFWLVLPALEVEHSLAAPQPISRQVVDAQTSDC